jgi:hypothetical protein
MEHTEHTEARDNGRRIRFRVFGVFRGEKKRYGGSGPRFPRAMPLAMVMMAVGQSECPLFASCRLTATGQSYFDQNRA